MIKFDRTASFLPLMLLLASCGDPVEWTCIDENPGEGAIITAVIDGDPFAAARSTYVWPAYLNPEEGRFSLNGSAFHGYTSEQIWITIDGFDGPGAYPIGQAGTPSGTQATYSCEAGGQGLVRSIGAPGDTVWIDSVVMGPMVVTGRFAFQGIGDRDSLPHMIENGEFRVGVHLAN